MRVKYNCVALEGYLPDENSGFVVPNVVAIHSYLLWTSRAAAAATTPTAPRLTNQ